MLEGNPHWREFNETEFLSSSDLEMLGVKESVFVITDVSEKNIKHADGNTNRTLLINLQGQSKAMQIYAKNSKALIKVTGSPYPNEWIGKSITVYISYNDKSFGKVEDRLRVRDRAPKTVIPQKELDADIAMINNCSKLDELKKVYGDCKHAQHPQVVAAKDKIKKVLK